MRCVAVPPLGRKHDRKGFHSGEQALDTYLVTTARQHAEKGISRTLVAVDDPAPERVVGYFTLTVAEIDRGLLADRQKRRMPKGGLPVIKRVRLAVDRDFQGRGMGGVLIVEALRRAIESPVITGPIAVLVEDKSERAAAFYAKCGLFVAFPDTPRVLCMGFGPIQKLLKKP